MYRVLLVDDEKWIIKGLSHGVAWENFDLTVIGEAYNGIQALEFIEKSKPDIVITDIQMPGMNGLELIKNAKVISPSTMFILLSGYAEFSYAQKALMYGAYSYCLKPFELEELEATLARAVKELNKRKLFISEDVQYISDILSSNNLDVIKNFLNKINLVVSAETPIIPIVSIGMEKVLMDSPIIHVCFKTGFQRYTYLINANDLEKATQHFKNHVLPSSSVGIGLEVSDYLMIDQSLDAVTNAAYTIFITGKGGIYYVNSMNYNDSITQIFSNLLNSMKKKEYSQISLCLDLAREEIYTNNLTIQHAYMLYNIINYMLHNDTISVQNTYIGDYEKLYLRFGDLDSMISYLKSFSFDVCSNTNSLTSSSSEHATIKEILKYIDEHLTEDFSIHDLSNKFFISGNYLSYLFKKEVGKNFIEYVTRNRIEYACNLLSNTEMQIQEISQNCGYNDYCYFAKIFKKYQKMTPTEYRSRITPSTT